MLSRLGVREDIDDLVQVTLAETADAEEASRLISSITGSEATLLLESHKVNAPLTDTGVVTDVLVALRERGIEVTELSLQKPSLDEVFLTITGHTAESATDNENEVDAA